MEINGAANEIHGVKGFDSPSLSAYKPDEVNGGPNPIPESPPKRYSIRDLLLVLSMLFIPMLTVAFVLLAFLFWSSTHIVFQDVGTPGLPVDLSPISNDSYYTTIGPSRIALVSGWASHASFFVMPPFMILFSYFVARDVAFQRPSAETINDAREIHDLLQGLLKGAWKETWTWFKFTFQRKTPGTSVELRAVHVAAAGMIITLLFTGLLIAGENWLHLSVSSLSLRVYGDVWIPKNLTDAYEIGSFVPSPDQCRETLSQPQLDPSAPSEFRPCSLNKTTTLYSLADAEDVYIILQSGIAPIPSEYNENSNTLLQQALSGSGSPIQVITHQDPSTNLIHAFLFNELSAVQESSSDGKLTNWGVDYVAAATSMVTTCEPITQACQLFNTTNSTSDNFSIPFNCSAMFSGDLNVAPTDGLEQFKGWYTSFYDMQDRLPRNISVASQLNPFLFNATAAVISTSFGDLESDYTPGVDPDIADHAVVNVGNNRVAFAVSCTATVYDVNYSLINGSIVLFKATPSDPRNASIIKAPLQVGFGRHSLFQSASLAVLDGGALVDNIAISFSQVGIALAAGAFESSLNLAERIRYDQVVTKVPRAPLWFLVVVCLLYATLGTGIAVAALYLRHVERYSEAQVELLPREPFNLKKLTLGCVSQVKDLVKPENGWGSLLKSKN